LGDVLEALDEVLAAGVERGAVAGVAVVVVDRRGVRYEAAFGERQLGSGVAMTVDSVGAIAAMTKPITGAAAMQLVERRQLDLDAPAMEVLPELDNLVVLADPSALDLYYQFETAAYAQI
jgi:methyl acetate hydrolase